MYPIDRGSSKPKLNVFVSILWILAIMNALNLLDVVDGLAGGIALTAFGTLLIVCMLIGHVLLANLLSILCGGIAGFLLFNGFRASLFLGDSGSMLLGLLLAVFAIAPQYAVIGHETALITPILIVAVPLYDLLFVVIIRLINGRSPVHKSLDHFVFRLIKIGYSPVRAAALLIVLGFLFSAAAMCLLKLPRDAGMIIIIGVNLLAILGGVKLARVKLND